MKHFLWILISFFNIYLLQGQEKKWIREQISLKNGNFFLDGELSYIDGEKLPLLLYVPGSGNIDRDGNQSNAGVQASYIKQITDSLNTRKIAVFRFDKRTANPKNTPFLDENIRFEDLVTDVKIIISHFKNDSRFSSINLLGHSKGSLVAMLALDESIRTFISIAGPAESAEDLVIAQFNHQFPMLTSTVKEHFAELKAHDTIKQVHPWLMPVFRPINQKFLKSYIAYQPADEIAKIQIPILIINGDKDLQVPVSEAKKLHAKAPNSKLVIIKNMTHVLKRISIPSENMMSYMLANYPIPSELIHEIVLFLQ